MSKPGKVLKGLCKKLGVRLTVKRNGKRVYKSVKILKAQCKKKKKKKVKRKVKRTRNFGKKSKNKIVDIKNFAKRNKIPIGVAASILGTVGLGYYIKNRKKNKSSKPEDEVDCTQFVTKRGCPVGCEWYEDECLNPATKKRLTDSLDGIPVEYHKQILNRRYLGPYQRKVKRKVYTIGEVHGINHSHYILDELFKYLESKNKIPYIFTEYGMITPKIEGFSISDYTEYLTKKFGGWFLKNNVIQISKELHNAAEKLTKAHFTLTQCPKNGIKIVLPKAEENFENKKISSYKKIFENKPFVSALDEINKIGYEELFINNVKKIGDEVKVVLTNGEYLKGKIIKLHPNYMYTIQFDDKEIPKLPKYNLKKIMIFREFGLKSFEVRSYADLDRVLKLRPTNILKTFNILEKNSIYKGILEAIEVLKKNTEGTYRKQIIHDFKIYKQSFKSFMENYEKFLESSKLLESKMGKDYEKLNKLHYYSQTSGPGPWVQDEMKRIVNKHSKHLQSQQPIITNLVNSFNNFTKIYLGFFSHVIKARDEYLKRKIDEKNKSVDKNIPFIVYLGVSHFANFDFSKDYEEINLIGKIQSIIQPDNNHLFPLTDTKYYKYRKSYRDLLKDKGIALSTSYYKLDKAAPGLGDWVEQMKSKNSNYSYAFGKRKRKRKVKRKRKKVKRKKKRKSKPVKRKRKRK